MGRGWEILREDNELSGPLCAVKRGQLPPPDPAPGGTLYIFSIYPLISYNISISFRIIFNKNINIPIDKQDKQYYIIIKIKGAVNNLTGGEL